MGNERGKNALCSFNASPVLISLSLYETEGFLERRANWMYFITCAETMRNIRPTIFRGIEITEA